MSICQNKKIMFLTGTRADFGHQKPLIDKCIMEGYDVFLFVTGMHLDKRHGEIMRDIDSCSYYQYYTYYNHIDKYGLLNEALCFVNR